MRNVLAALNYMCWFVVDSGGLGVQLLLPHVPSLLDYIKKVVEKMNQQTGKNRIMPATELNILAM